MAAALALRDFALLACAFEIGEQPEGNQDDSLESVRESHEAEGESADTGSESLADDAVASSELELAGVRLRFSVVDDPDFAALCDLFARSKLCRAFVTTAVRNHPDGPPLAQTFETWGRVWGTLHQQGVGEGVEEADEDDITASAGRLLDSLDHTHGGEMGRHRGNLRGAILEGLVLTALVHRYAGGELVDNAEIEITNGAVYTSPTGRPIDVAAWDGALGECHDCKMSARNLETDLVDHLACGLPRPAFRLAVVTGDSETVARRELGRKGYKLPTHVTLVSMEDLVDLVPLQTRAA